MDSAEYVHGTVSPIARIARVIEQTATYCPSDSARLELLWRRSFFSLRLVDLAGAAHFRGWTLPFLLFSRDSFHLIRQAECHSPVLPSSGRRAKYRNRD